MKTFAFIPTKFAVPDNLYSLLNTLSEEKIVDKIYVLNNSDLDVAIRIPRVQTLDLKNYTIYEMWNRAIEYIQYNYPNQKTNIAILNDDIEITNDTLSTLATYLRKDDKLGIISPDPNGTLWNSPMQAVWSVKYTDTTAGAGGITGYCFMIKGELPIKVDENLKLYWGDDDLVKQVISLGYKAAILDGCPVHHFGSATIKKMDAHERLQIMEQDRQYFNNKYNEHREPAW